jgi:hypothetical protein
MLTIAETKFASIVVLYPFNSFNEGVKRYHPPVKNTTTFSA